MYRVIDEIVANMMRTLWTEKVDYKRNFFPLIYLFSIKF